MKRFLTLLAFAGALAVSAGAAPLFLQPTAANRTPGVQPALAPAQYRTLTVADAALRSWLFSLADAVEESQVMDLPTPDGGTRAFRVWQTHVMHPDLAAKYPDIKTFMATALDNPSVVAKLDYSPRGFRAMVMDGASTFFIDPYGPGGEGHAIAYYKRDYSRAAGQHMVCAVTDEEETMEELQRAGGIGSALKLYGTTSKTYRLAVACTGEYSVAVTTGGTPSAPLTKANVLARIVTSVNRVSGVYEKEFSVTLQLIANNDTLINLDGTTDPYSNNNGGTMLGQNQTAVDARVGTVNYDVGHVFSTGGGGVAQAGICSSSNKARGVTGGANPVGDPFDIDYVAHEMGHQFTGSHTFNSNVGSCSGNGVSSSAFEPGSGTTIMAYAGICSPDNVQPNSDAYFHARSLLQITNNLETGSASGCGTSAATGNDIPAVASFTSTDTFVIPTLAHFELTAPPVTNSLSSAPLTYCWEQYDAGNASTTFANTTTTGPLFRSIAPDTGKTRVFPRIRNTVRNVINDNVGEKLPTVARFMRFTLTVRDVYNGFGAFSWGEDTVRMRVVNTGDTFRVTSQGGTVPATYLGASTQTVEWDVAGTTAAPINATTVNIFYSLDSGYTYPYTLASGVPNNGTAQVVLPNVSTTAGRFKVKATGNVFFDLNDRPFTVTFDPIAAGIASTPWAESVVVYPVPAREQVFVKVPAGKSLSAAVTNALGQGMWAGSLEGGSASIEVGRWAKGVYTLSLLDAETGEKAVKRIVVE